MKRYGVSKEALRVATSENTYANKTGLCGTPGERSFRLFVGGH